MIGMEKVFDDSPGANCTLPIEVCIEPRTLSPYDAMQSLKPESSLVDVVAVAGPEVSPLRITVTEQADLALENLVTGRTEIHSAYQGGSKVRDSIAVELSESRDSWGKEIIGFCWYDGVNASAGTEGDLRPRRSSPS